MAIGPLTVPLIKAGTSILGGLLGRNDEPEVERTSLKRQRKELNLRGNIDAAFRKKDTLNKYRHLVSGAKRAGFNPLTALGAGGASGSQASVGAPQITTTVEPQKQNIGSILANGVADGLDAYQDPVERESRVLDNELKKQQIAQYQNESERFGRKVRPVRETASATEETGQPLSGKDRRPHADQKGPAIRPHPTNQPRTPMYLPGHGVVNVLNSVVPTGKGPFDTLTVGDVSEIGGEVLGEGTAVLQIEKVTKRLFDTNLFETTEGSTDQEIEDAYNFENRQTPKFNNPRGKN